MLVARADRVHPAADREIRTAIAAELTRGAGREDPVGDSLTVAVRPVAGPARRSPARAWAIVAAVVVVALVVAAVIVLPRDDQRTTPSPFTPPSAADASDGASAAVGDPALQAFATNLGNGLLDGRLVVLVGRFEPDVIECPGSNGGCLQGGIVGLPDVIVTSPPGSLSISQAAVGSANRELAFRVDGTSLDFLGTLQQDPSSPITVNQLSGSLPPPDRLAVVAATLRPVLAQFCPDAAASPRCRGDDQIALYQAAGSQLQTGALVTVSEQLREEVRSHGEQLDGTFLVAFDRASPASSSPLNPPRLEGTLRIVDRLDASLERVAPSVAAPPPTASPTAVPEGLLAPDDLRALTGDASATGSIVVANAELSALAVPCPRATLCFALTLHGLEGVPIDADAPVDMERAQSVPVYGDLTFRVGRGRLQYLGIAPEPFEPLTVVALTASDLAPSNQLAEARGWVVFPARTCPAANPGASPCTAPTPLLTDVGPPSDVAFPAGDAIPVAIAGPIAEAAVGAGPVVAGPFLVRRIGLSDCPSGSSSPGAGGGSSCAGEPAWEVVAVLDERPVLRASLP
jgi:hypothetical protein